MSDSRVEIAIPLLSGDRSLLPSVRPVRQRLHDERIDDVPDAVRQQLSKENITSKIEPGMRIAIGVGSRGISGYVDTVRTLVSMLKDAGADPFLVPAMGSHGGGSAEGQIEMLEGLGITEVSTGAPVRATMDTVVVGELADGTPLHLDANAADADGIVVVNRIKAHTLFRGPLESGLVKMLVAGLGKAVGVAALHGQGTENFATMLPEGFEILRSKAKVLFGLALLENGFSELCMVEAVPVEAMAEREPELLVQANEWMAGLFFDELDVLILDKIGKDISGQGADPNVIRRNTWGNPVLEGPNIKRLVGLGITEKSHGNASGIGQFDIVTGAMLRDTDYAATYANILPTTYVDLAAIPMAAATPADAAAVAIRCVPGRKAADIRLVYAQDTKHLGTIYVSPALAAEVEAHPRLEWMGAEEPLARGDELIPWS